MAQPRPNVFEIFNPAHRRDPYPVYRAVADAGPLHEMGPHRYLATRLADCAEVLRGTEWGHGYDDKINPFRPGVGRDLIPGSILSMDEPAHTRLRRIVSKSFTQRRVSELAERAEQLAAELLGAALEHNEVDLVQAFCYTLPLTIICELIGVPPGDYPVFAEWSHAIVRGVDPDDLLSPAEIEARYEGQAAFEDYFRGLVKERISEHRGDLLSDLVVSYQHGALSEDELLELASTLIIAGHETTVNAISNTLLAMHRQPDQWAALCARPELVEAAAEEGLRIDSPLQFTARTALRDMELAGQAFHRGDGVVLMVGAANRDPAAFENPDSFDITRYDGSRQSTRHIAFALGAHHCLGARLARMELTVALSALARLVPGMRILSDDLEYRDLFLLRGPRHLPVRLRP